ncbi:MAG: Glycosyltransferase Gtf1 [Bacteroidia bacterium]|nr:Glycosyltransferase Gtf1 [Bacteroidia bacterium]
MLKEKRLYIIVSDYPFGNGEPFLEDELSALSKRFEKITLIITSPIPTKENDQKFSVPENVEFLFYNSKNTLKSKLRAIHFSLTNAIFFNELKIIRDKYKLPIAFSSIKFMYSYLIHGLQFLDYLKKIINQDNSHKGSYYFYTYWCTYYTLSLALLKRKNKEIKTFTRVHGWDLYMYRHQPPYLPFRNFIFNSIDKTFSVSENGKNYLLENIPDIHSQKIALNYLGTSVNSFPEIIHNRKKLLVITLSFISKVKRLELVVESISQISDFDIEWHHIGGYIDNSVLIEQYAKDLLLGKKNITCHFHGTLSKQEIFDFIKTHPVNVLINTSWSEGLPVSIMEAMSFGIPVIATDVGGSCEIVENGKNGILLPSNPSVEEVKTAIRKIYEINDDEYKTLCLNAYNTWNVKFNNKKNNQIFINQIYSIDQELYKVCSRCILDNIDYPEISFNSEGVCDMCRAYDEISARHILLTNNNEIALSKLVHEIKEKGKAKEYDCIIGLSGGVDSSYVAYKAKQLGLKPLIVHLDNGWNSELAVKNIENIVKKLDFDLYTHVINWNEFKDLQLSYIRASVVDIEALTDHAINAVLYSTASKHGIKYILSGENIVTEGRIPPNWAHLKNDLINIKNIHRIYGKLPIKTFPTLGILKLFFYQKIKGIKTIPLLDYIDYNKNKAKATIVSELEWRDYGGKHYESVFTRFYQSYILPVKFHADKRKSHYSTLICSGQLTKDEALELMKLPAYDKEKLKEDKEYVIKKLGLSENEFDELMKKPIRKHTDYKSIVNYYNVFINAKRVVKKIVN